MAAATQASLVFVTASNTFSGPLNGFSTLDMNSAAPSTGAQLPPWEISSLLTSIVTQSASFSGSVVTKTSTSTLNEITSSRSSAIPQASESAFATLSTSPPASPSTSASSSPSALPAVSTTYLALPLGLGLGLGVPLLLALLALILVLRRLSAFRKGPDRQSLGLRSRIPPEVFGGLYATDSRPLAHSSIWHWADSVRVLSKAELPATREVEPAELDGRMKHESKDTT